jgi:type I restriction-modification system DNA methylase subunit
LIPLFIDTALAADFRANAKFHLSPQYQEAEVRKDYIDKLFIALGWDVNHEAQRNPFEQEVKVEPPVATGLAHRRADYAFHIAPNFRDARLIVEAKRPHTELATADNYFQTVRYGWNKQNSLAGLTNFAEFHLLDCRYKPDINNVLQRCVKKYDLNAYVDKDTFAELYWLFSREAVASGSLEKCAASLPKPRGKSRQLGPFAEAYQTIDESFLLQLDDFRLRLARAFKSHNHDLDSETLTEITQRTLDRLVFMRFLEDKLIEPRHYVSEFGRGGSAWRDFVATSRHLNGTYNGIVFKRHLILDADDFSLDEGAFEDVCEELCHLNSPFDFNAIPIHILGSIYERFLSNVIIATAERVRVEAKPDLRKAGGVYYTPEFVVRYIVDNTVGKLIENKTPNEIADMRFADIACGSGSFLLGIFDLLLRYHSTYYNQNRRKVRKGDCIEQDGVLHLSLEKKREILLNNIYGVDIDAQAVEVTQLSLYLKLLEEETIASAHGYQLRMHATLLPSLSRNIVCGNSIIGPEILKSELFRADQERKLNPMSFEARFPDIMRRGGFDAIVGNPPYLNIDDTWGRHDVRLKAIKESYPEIYTDKTDVLFYFLARAVRLSKGPVGFIVSRAFLEAYKAHKLRAFLLNHTRLREIVDFRDYYVFPKVGITTCLIFLDHAAKAERLRVYRLVKNQLPAGELGPSLSDASNFERISVQRSALSSASWAFASSAVVALNAKIDSGGEPLGTILTVGQGMQTGRNDVFGGHSKKELREWGLKSGEFFQRASNSDIQRYFIHPSGEYLIYPENFATFSSLPHEVQNYLKRHRAELESRAAFRRGDCEWWRYTWPLHSDLYDRPRLLCPYLATANRFALDDSQEYLGLTDTTVLFENRQPEDLRYVLALLNSKLLTFRFRSIGKLKSAGILEYFWNSISKLPIRRINLTDPRGKEHHSQMVKLTDEMLEAKEQLRKAKSDQDADYWEGKSITLDQRIDSLVYELYDLTKEEIAIIERALTPPQTSAAYADDPHFESDEA